MAASGWRGSQEGGQNGGEDDVSGAPGQQEPAQAVVAQPWHGNVNARVQESAVGKSSVAGVLDKREPGLADHLPA